MNGISLAMRATVEQFTDMLTLAPAPQSGTETMTEYAEAWRKQMLAFGRKPKTVASYHGVVTQAIREMDWTKPGDLNAASVEDLMARKRASGEWIGTTINRNVCALRSFAKYLERRGLAERGSLEDVPRARDDGGQGSRASTREEATRLLLLALARERGLGYKRANRPLQHLLCFMAGLRCGEPGQLEWGRHIDLACPVPHIHWTRDISKNGREQDVALHPQLADALLIHRADMIELAKTIPEVIVRNKRMRNDGPVRVRFVHPDHTGSFVFPYVSSCFEKDAARAGIARKDARGRSYSPHSARKFFETAPIECGVNPRMVDFLMRHRGGVASRYFDPDLSEQVSALARLAPICEDFFRKLGILAHSDLQRPHPIADTDTSNEGPVHHNSSGSPANESGATFIAESSVADGAGLPDPLRSGKRAKKRGSSESSGILNVGMPIPAFGNAGDSNALADFLESVARLLRGSSDGQGIPS